MGDLADNPHPPTDAVELKRILHPTDFSELSIHALQYAELLARTLQAGLHCLTVTDPSFQYWSLPDPGMMPMPVGPAVEEIEADTKKQLAAHLEKHLARDIQAVQAIAIGQPFIEIISYARDNNIDLIVMGTHGRSALKQVLMGSVAEKVVRKSPCPVLTVRSPGHVFEMP